jgi:NAD-dependent deacetylase
MHEPVHDVPAALLARLSPTCKVAVLTGAGISAASGVPTFRGSDGLWKNHPVQELATPEAFARQPAVVWEWYGWRRDLVREARPNSAHLALLELARRVARVGIITQNVDGLHQRHGLPHNADLVELHGSLWRVRCTRCGAEAVNLEPGPPPGVLPHCGCGGLQRPAIVWFGEPLSPSHVRAAGEWTAAADVLLVVGTSAVVQPAASLVQVAIEAGAAVVELNTETTPASRLADWVLAGPCQLTLPALVHAIDHHRGGPPR